MDITDIMSRDLAKIDVEETVRTAANTMSDKGIGSIFADQDGILVGVITERDLLTKIVATGRDPQHTKVKDIMAFPLITVPADYTIDDVIYLMATLKIRHVAVEEDGTAVGVITARDIIAHKLKEETT